MSENPDERLIAHNKGKVTSTKPYKPWVKFFSEEAGSDAAEARQKEKYYKSSTGRRYSKSHLSFNRVSVYMPSVLRQILSQKQMNLFFETIPLIFDWKQFGNFICLYIQF